jgi:uncharacterized damage-inducible protein DinB
MNAADIRSLFAYDRWANDKVIEAVAGLDPEQFVRTIPSSFPSVRETLAHLVSAEWLWLERWKGHSPKAMLDGKAFPSLDPLRRRWSEIASELEAFVGALEEQALGRTLSYVNLAGQRREYPLVRTMQHLANHSTYHRGQLTTLLRQLDVQPPATDLLVYEDERGPR